MASHAPLLTSENYVTLLTDRIDGRIADASKQFDPAYSSPTNVLTNSMRFTSATSKWERWNGTSWVDAATSYSINITGNSANVNGVVPITNGGTGAVTGIAALSALQAAPATLDYTGYSLIPTDAKRLVTMPDTSLQAQQYNGTSWVARDFSPNSNLLSRTATASQAIASPLVLSGAITGVIDSATTLCVRGGNVQGVDLNTFITPCYRFYAASNVVNINGPVATPAILDGLIQVTNSGLSITQTIKELSDSFAAGRGRVFQRSWYTPTGASTAVWREVLHVGDDITVKSITATEQPSISFYGSAGTSQTIPMTVSNAVGVTHSAGLFTVARAGTYILIVPFASAGRSSPILDVSLIDIIKNGVASGLITVQHNNSTLGFAYTSVKYFKLAAGDTFRFATANNTLSTQLGDASAPCIFYRLP